MRRSAARSSAQGRGRIVVAGKAVPPLLVITVIDVSGDVFENGCTIKRILNVMKKAMRHA